MTVSHERQAWRDIEPEFLFPAVPATALERAPSNPRCPSPAQAHVPPRYCPGISSDSVESAGMAYLLSHTDSCWRRTSVLVVVHLVSKLYTSRNASVVIFLPWPSTASTWGRAVLKKLTTSLPTCVADGSGGRCGPATERQVPQHSHNNNNNNNNTRRLHKLHTRHPRRHQTHTARSLRG